MSKFAKTNVELSRRKCHTVHLSKLCFLCQRHWLDILTGDRWKVTGASHLSLISGLSKSHLSENNQILKKGQKSLNLKEFKRQIQCHLSKVTDVTRFAVSVVVLSCASRVFSFYYLILSEQCSFWMWQVVKSFLMTFKRQNWRFATVKSRKYKQINVELSFYDF